MHRKYYQVHYNFGIYRNNKLYDFENLRYNLNVIIKNLRPICAPCNASMGTMSMDDFAMTYFGYSV